MKATHWIFTATLLLAAGCGGETAMPGSEPAEKVAAVVTSLNDAAGDETAFSTFFVDGNAPEDRSSYYSAAIELIGVPEVNGDDATAMVRISKSAIEAEGQGALKTEEVGDGEVTWTLTKVGEEWKLKDAPLPGA